MKGEEDKFTKECQIFENDWVDVFTDFKKEMSSDIISLKASMSEISKETLSLKEDSFLAMETLRNLTQSLVDSMDLLKESDELISKKTQEFKRYVDVFSELEDKTITINNADIMFIIEEMAKIVGNDVKKSLACSLEKNDVIRKFKNISGVSKKVEEQLDETIKGLKELLLHCQKGSEDIYTSELILLKLMSVLRFLDRLSDKDRERIINSDFIVHEDVAKKIEYFLQNNNSVVTERIPEQKETTPIKGFSSNERKIEVIETDISSINKRLDSLESTIKQKFNDVLSALSKKQHCTKEISYEKNQTRKTDTSKKTTTKDKKEDARQTVKAVLNKMFPSDKLSNSKE